MRCLTSATRRMLAAASLAMVVSCGSDSTGPNAPITGEWIGSASNVSFDMNLADNTGTISGTGTASGAAGTLGITVTGSRSHAHVTMTVSSSGFSDVSFVGDVTNGTQLQGTLNGSGYSNTALTLTKQ